MNAQATRQQLLAPEWVVTVHDELTRNPAAVPFAIEPAILGEYDAAMGNVCAPLVRGYRTLADVTAYIDSYKATQAAMVAAVEETIDYEEDMLDREFWRQGAW